MIGSSTFMVNWKKTGVLDVRVIAQHRGDHGSEGLLF